VLCALPPPARGLALRLLLRKRAWHAVAGLGTAGSPGAPAHVAALLEVGSAWGCPLCCKGLVAAEIFFAFSSAFPEGGCARAALRRFAARAGSTGGRRAGGTLVGGRAACFATRFSHRLRRRDAGPRPRCPSPLPAPRAVPACAQAGLAQSDDLVARAADLAALLDALPADTLKAALASLLPARHPAAAAPAAGPGGKQGLIEALQASAGGEQGAGVGCLTPRLIARKAQRCGCFAPSPSAAAQGFALHCTIPLSLAHSPLNLSRARHRARRRRTASWPRCAAWLARWCAWHRRRGARLRACSASISSARAKTCRREWACGLGAWISGREQSLWRARLPQLPGEAGSTPARRPACCSRCRRPRRCFASSGSSPELAPRHPWPQVCRGRARRHALAGVLTERVRPQRVAHPGGAARVRSRALPCG
jgi:hypothetical protein